ncbi:rod shape-determining protein MreC [Candidatus Parcubacteria bacterium]|nr:rod shape-determining protein MreC [Candidatus Parcubacteria bacterium]
MQFLKKNLFVSFFLAFLLVFLYFFQNTIQNFIYALFSPFQSFFWELSLKIKTFFSTIISLWQAQKENQILKQEIQTLKGEIANLKLKEKENEILKEALNLKENGFQVFPSKVVAKAIDEDFIVIEGGTKHNIKEGMVVIGKQKQLIGKISKTYQNFSQVQLIFAKHFQFDGQTLDSKVNFLVEGASNFKLKLKFLPKESEIKEGETILTSSLSGKFPEGLLVGKVEKIFDFPTKNFKEGIAKVEFTSEDLDSVFVILDFLPWEKK